MTTLVLNVDRDDDFGRKAHISSPIIGYGKNVDAAQTFGQIDPEDSDLNAIYYAISVYKKVKESKDDVEIATICGHMNVGIKSDTIIAKQFDEVLSQIDVEDVILVTDGAEDDYILPIIESRAKISSLQRVSVKQSRQLEDTYYRLLKLMDDEKVQKQFLLPIALVFIVGSIFVLLDMISSGMGAILLTLGAYLLVRVFRLEKNLFSFISEIKSGFLTGKLTLYTSFIAAVILIASMFLAYNNANFASDVEWIPILSFIANMIWGIVIAGLLVIFGHVVDSYVKNKKAPWHYWIYPFSLFAFGFISSAIFESLHKALLNWPDTFYIEPFFTPFFIGNTLTGIMITIVGAVTYHYIKEMVETKENEMEVEKQTN
jgi:putative membrane protein